MEEVFISYSSHLVLDDDEMLLWILIKAALNKLFVYEQDWEHVRTGWQAMACLAQYKYCPSLFFLEFPFYKSVKRIYFFFCARLSFFPSSSALFPSVCMGNHFWNRCSVPPVLSITAFASLSVLWQTYTHLHSFTPLERNNEVFVTGELSE